MAWLPCFHAKRIAPSYEIAIELGSVIGLADGTGQQIANFEYDSFGNLRNSNGTATETPEILGGDFRFQGQWLEAHTDFYNFRARYYDPETGLFLSRDPIDFIAYEPESTNPYQFAYNNPQIYTDPSGEFTLIQIKASFTIDDILKGIQNQAYDQAIDTVKDKTSELFGNIISGTLKNLMPGGSIGDELNTWVTGSYPDFGGDMFEDFLVGTFCRHLEGILGGTPFLDWLWLTPEIALNGEPLHPGTNCSTGPTESPLPASTGSSTNTPNNADFLFKNGHPVNDKADRGTSYVIGDFKISLKKALEEASQSSDQWKAISSYAENYSISRTVIYLSFVRSWNGKLTDTLMNDMVKEILEKEVIPRKLLVFFVNLFD